MVKLVGVEYVEWTKESGVQWLAGSGVQVGDWSKLGWSGLKCSRVEYNYLELSGVAYSITEEGNHSLCDKTIDISQVSFHF